MSDRQKHEDPELPLRMARAARIALELGMIIPDDATPEELLMLQGTHRLARVPASRPMWRRFWQRERSGRQLPSELRVVPTGRSKEEQEANLDKVRRMRRLLEERGVAVPDDAAPEDLQALIWQHRPSWQLQSVRELVRKNWGIKLPDDATFEEHGKVIELLNERRVLPRIPNMLFWRRFWPRLRSDLLADVRYRELDGKAGEEP